MPVKLYKPTSPARRHTSVDDFSDITKSKPEKSLVLIKKQHAGRNVHGRITVRHRGGGEKRYVRLLDFRQERFDIPAKVVAIEFDPNRSARIALIIYVDGVKSYIVAPQKLKVGDQVLSSQKAIKVEVASRMPLQFIPVGMNVYNVELFPGKGGQLARSAGTLVRLVAVEGDYALLKLPSGEVRKILKHCLASIGEVSNPDHMHIRYGKAGRMRHLGIRPTVRGKAMNPVDHPHGGGEGRNPIGMKFPKTPWGKHALGVRTRKNKKNNKYIVRRRGKK